jgi:hypothetical protein
MPRTAIIVVYDEDGLEAFPVHVEDGEEFDFRKICADNDTALSAVQNIFIGEGEVKEVDVDAALSRTEEEALSCDG